VKYTLSMTTAAVYLRISLDRTGEMFAVTRQRQDCLKLCEQRGWTPLEYVDNDVSATSGKRRPGYQRMLADIRDGKIGAVVAWDADRLHRQPRELEDFIDLADGHKLALATVGGDFDLATPTGRGNARMKGVFARMEMEQKSARQKREARQKAERGVAKWRNAFGYLDMGGDLRELDPKTAPLVKQAYAAILAGSSLKDIAKLFNDAGAYGLTGKPWRDSTVSLFVRKPRNAGLREHNGQIIGKGTWPALVDESTWRAAQKVLDAPGRAPGRKTVRRHRLTGVLGCGRCGHYLSGQWTTQKTIVYGCKQCHGVSIRAEHVEPLLMRVVAGRLAQPDAIDLLRAELHDEAEAEKLRTEANTLLARLDEIADERADGLLTGKQAKRATERINNKLTELERRQQDQEKLRVFDGIPLGKPEATDAVQRLSPDRFRAVLDVLLTVTVAPVGKGGRVFNPERVQVNWR
jgi:DNA invertase Pin-like site-specific DNA recombinase